MQKRLKKSIRRYRKTCDSCNFLIEKFKIKYLKIKREVFLFFWLSKIPRSVSRFFCFASLHKRAPAQLGLQFGYHLEKFCNFFVHLIFLYVSRLQILQMIENKKSV